MRCSVFGEGGCSRVAFSLPAQWSHGWQIPLPLIVGNAAVKSELWTPEGPQISSVSCMFWCCGGSVKSPHLTRLQSASADDTGCRPQVSRLLFILATAVQQSQEHGSSYPRIICPPPTFNAWSRVFPAFGQRIELVRVTEREERKPA